jgi:hypothetical protein
VFKKFWVSQVLVHGRNLRNAQLVNARFDTRVGSFQCGEP